VVCKTFSRSTALKFSGQPANTALKLDPLCHDYDNLIWAGSSFGGLMISDLFSFYPETIRTDMVVYVNLENTIPFPLL